MLRRLKAGRGERYGKRRGNDRVRCGSGRRAGANRRWSVV